MLHITSNIFHLLGLNIRENVLAFAHFLAHNSAGSLAHRVPSSNRKKDGANATSVPRKKHPQLVVNVAS